jgi:arachidonate 15-lipoxygenase
MSFLPKLRPHASLPQNDSNKAARAANLAEKREKFQFNYEIIGEIPVSDQVPEEAVAGTLWKVQIIASAYKMRKNIEAVLKKNPHWTFERPIPKKNPIELAKMLAKSDLEGFLGYCLPEMGIVTSQFNGNDSRDYENMFQVLDLPKWSQTLYNDSDFAEYFLSGLNPVLIECVKSAEDDFPVTEDHFRSVAGFEGDSLAAAYAEGRVFKVDYKDLSELKAGVHPRASKKVYAPKILFAVPQGGGELAVIAIQSGQDPNEYPIFTPDKSWSWLSAKLVAKIADGNYHEAITHLGLTHLLIDPINVATLRQLPEQHPINRLLVPHFEGTIPINALAVKKLLPTNGAVEQQLSATIESAYETLRRVRRGYDFLENTLPRSIARRGVDASGALKSYAYRDDGLLIWDSIASWVSDYVDIYYKNDGDIAADSELQAWGSECYENGKVQGFGDQGQIRSKDVLKEILTMIIFTASAQHAAVNFPQTEAALVSANPLAGYADAPKSKSLTEKDFAAFMPPIDRALKQVHTLSLLGSVHYTILGGYPLGTFLDLHVDAKLLEFRAKLLFVEGKILHRNSKRRVPYTHLLPTRIPNSINI